MYINYDDVLSEMSDEELVEYLEDFRNMKVITVEEEPKTDVDFLQYIADYIMENYTSHGTIFSKEDLMEKLTEIVDNNYLFIKKSL